MKCYVLLAGGLGNQIFQVAAALQTKSDKVAFIDFLGNERIGLDGYPDILSLNIACKLELVRPTKAKRLLRWYFLWQLGSTSRPESLRFSVADSKFVRGISSFLVWLVTGVRTKVVLENRGEVGSFKRFSKKHPNFLIGYFQDYAVSLELRNQLDLLHPVRSEENMVSLGDFLELKRAIGVHVRRGDYVNHPTFGLLSRQYFRNALLSIEDSLRPIFIFSDSKVDLRDFVPEHLLQMSQVCQESFSATQVLYLMSRCSDLILSNSSLSWWGGWLATQRGSQVFAPHPWFLNEIQSTNFYPPEWFKLQSNFVTECDN